MENNKLVLKNVKAIFFHKDDAKFGSSITIDATDKTVKESIEKFVKDHSIKFKFNDYTDKEGKTTTQATFKLAKFVEIKDADKNSVQEVKYNSIISLAISSYDYDNNFGKGTTMSVSKIGIITPAVTKSDAEFNELFA